MTCRRGAVAVAAPATTRTAAATAPTRPWSDPGWVAAENRRPGTSAWHLTHLGAAHAIEGWADSFFIGLHWRSHGLTLSHWTWLR
jgi:hypothetical protein